MGGGLGYTYLDENNFFTFGANAGYRYVTSFGMYFSLGGYFGGMLSEEISLDLKPLLGIGYLF